MISRLTGAWSPLLAVFAGALAVPGFAPFNAWPLVLLSLVVLFTLWWRASASRAALIGFCFGLGLFGVGVSWIYVSLHFYGGMPNWLAALAVALFCAYLSIYPMIAGWLAARLRTRGKLGASQSLLVLIPAMFVAGEFARGWVVSGFPWLIVGYSQTPGSHLLAPLAGVAPLFGVFGVSMALAVTAGVVVWTSPALSGQTLPRQHRRRAWVAITILWLAGVLLQRMSWSDADGAPISVALVQGNIEQSLKWREDQRGPTLQRYADLTAQSKAALTVLPETALPMLLQEIPIDALMAYKRHGEDNRGDVLLGVSVAQAAVNDPDSRDQRDLVFYNSALSLGKSKSERYDKRHLVAFGEFTPPMFAWVFQWLSIPMSSYAHGAPRQAPMLIAGTNVGVNICYEDAFGSEIARQLPDAKLLVNISNMAWFGTYLAADQHAQFSQMRALETSRWMLRATNTGLTAAINERGEIVDRLPTYAPGVLNVAAQPRRGTTPYVVWTDWPILGWIAIVLAWVLIRGRGRLK